MNEATEAMTPRPTDAWEKRRREDMRIRNRQYGFFPVAKEGSPLEYCPYCSLCIFPSANNIRIEGQLFHGECFVRSSRASRKNNR